MDARELKPANVNELVIAGLSMCWPPLSTVDLKSIVGAKHSWFLILFLHGEMDGRLHVQTERESSESKESNSTVENLSRVSCLVEMEWNLDLVVSPQGLSLFIIITSYCPCVNNLVLNVSCRALRSITQLSPLSLDLHTSSRVRRLFK
jgi:hypothetical protein